MGRTLNVTSWFTHISIYFYGKWKGFRNPSGEGWRSFHPLPLAFHQTLGKLIPGVTAPAWSNSWASGEGVMRRGKGAKLSLILLAELQSSLSLLCFLPLTHVAIIPCRSCSPRNQLPWGQRGLLGGGKSREDPQALRKQMDPDHGFLHRYCLHFSSWGMDFSSEY